MIIKTSSSGNNFFISFVSGEYGPFGHCVVLDGAYEFGSIEKNGPGVNPPFAARFFTGPPDVSAQRPACVHPRGQ